VSEASATAVYLAMASMFFAIALWKGMAFLREPTPTLALMTANFVTGGVVYSVASPLGYRTLGSVFDHPWIATLPIYVGILVCYGKMHVLTVLWTPHPAAERSQTRREVALWALAYSLAVTIMVWSFLAADLDGPADPLRFNTQQADEPHALIFLAVFFGTLASATLNTWRRSRRAQVDDDWIAHALRWFGGSMVVTFGYVVCSAPAVTAAAIGRHELDTMGVLGSGFGVVGCIGTCYGMTGAAVSAWLRERRDSLALDPLWDLVVAGVDEQLSFDSARHPNHGDSDEQPSGSSGPAGHSAPDGQPTGRWDRLINIRWTLTRQVVEILDGFRELRVWVRDEPKQVLEALHGELLSNKAARERYGLPEGGLSPVDLEAAATAAVLRDAVERFQAARAAGTTTLPVPAGSPAEALGRKKAPYEERPRLVRVARALNDPLVEAALQVIRTAGDADQPSRETAIEAK
jgi:hypothetical protein